MSDIYNAIIILNYTYVLNKSWDNINKLNHYLKLLMNLE